jgi:predicted permease
MDPSPRRTRVYRVLLWLFPRDVRASFGDDMVELFARQREQLHGASRVRFWLRVIADAVRHGIGERLDRMRQPQRQRSRWWMDTLGHDFRHACRLMIRQPGISATILLTLALGIGANTAVFSVVHAVLLRPLPYADPDRLVMIWEKRPAEGVMNNVVSPADFLDWAKTSQSFTSMAAYSADTADLTGVGDPVQVPLAGVTSAFFDVLGVRALHGRTFAIGEDVLGRHRIVVLSHAVWQQRFGGDASVIGRTIQLNGIPHEVIGILPRDFEFPGETADLWAPLVLQGGTEPPPRAAHFLNVYARLAPGVPFESARAEMDRIGNDLERAYPAMSQGHGAHVVPLREEIVAPARGGLLIVMSAVAFLLLIASTNVANLLLARGAGRRREMAIRSAVGAGRGRLLRQTLTESLVLSVLGGVAGLLIAWWTLQLLVSETPPVLRGAGLDRAQLDLPVLLFTLAVCVITGLIAGALPAWQVSSEELGDPLREGGRSPVSLRRGLRFTLIATEVALTALLLVGAGLMLRSFVRVLSQPPGIETAKRLTVNLALPRTRYPDPDALRRARRNLDERFSGIPGVIAAGANNNLPLTASDARRGITIEGLERREGDSPVRSHTRIVTPSYFKAAGIKIREGRGFTSADDAVAPLVVVINDTMARRYWPGQSAVGKRMRFNDPNAPWREVVGVIDDVKHWGLDREVNPETYMPHEQQPSATLTYVLHAAADPSVLVGPVTEHVRAFDADLPLGSVRTMEEVAAKSVGTRRWSALLLGMFAVLGLVLAAAGIYGVMAHLVSMRTGEIGIRMTLGARPVGVLRQILGEALVQASLGLGIGLVVAFAVMRGLESMLFQITAADPITFIGTMISVLVVAGLASAVPAIRAMRVDPIQALRGE